MIQWLAHLTFPHDAAGPPVPQTPSRLPTPQSPPDPSVSSVLSLLRRARLSSAIKRANSAAGRGRGGGGGFNALSLACYRFLFYFWRQSYRKRKYSVTNSHSFVLKISPNCDRKWPFFFFFCYRSLGAEEECRHVHVYWLHIYAFSGKESPVKSKSA
jgi:hypothetical protein